MDSKIYEWNEIRDKYTESIILGNGASIAVSNTFNYESLYKKATELNFITSELNALFENFDTKNFEAIMHKLLQAETVNHSLSLIASQLKMLTMLVVIHWLKLFKMFIQTIQVWSKSSVSDNLIASFF